MADVNVGFTGWGASGVTWGEDPWGQSAASLPVGTGQVGSVTVTGATSIAVTVTGLSATGQVGSVTVTGSANVTLTGVSATGNVGSVSVTGSSSATVTGLSATG